VKFGDKNSSFFHTQTIIRIKKNKIHKLQLPNGSWSSDNVILLEEALKYFKNLFCSNQDSHQNHHFNEGHHPSLNDDDRNSLTSPLTKKEVTAALHSPYKAPGPDGFLCIFFKQYWHIVGDDVFNLVNPAFLIGHFDPTISDTLIALIPKVDPPLTYKDFRPISLCNIIYKIITKVLAHCLRPILNNIIDPYQSSFLPGSGTTDNAIVLLEVIHYMCKSKKKKGYVAFKIDLEKAFDNINWDFLRSCLCDYGFPDTTIKLIMHCFTSSSFSILWNGNKLPPFHPSHGLRQGDPLSLYLFILCMEKLSSAINNAVHQGNWEPVHISNLGPKLSHLLFADDVLLFTKANSTQLRFIRDLFDRFSKSLGLKINLHKSRAFYSSGVTRDQINTLTSISGIRCNTSLDKYLGFPIIKWRPNKSDFLFIIEKMQKRLASWKNKLLNKSGRLALASSVLSSIPTYYMQINWLPQSVCANIDQVTRNFIWRDSNNKGIHLVGWEKITKPKDSGGLGIRAARITNTSLLGKLVWDIMHSSNKLWVQLLSNKYFPNTHMLRASAPSSCSSIWAAIICAKSVLHKGFEWRHGIGNSSFWFTSWSSSGPLAPLVPFINIHDLHLTIKDVISSPEPHTHILYTTLPLEVPNHINNLNIRSNDFVEDTFVWSPNINSVYTAKSGYNWLLSHSNYNNTTSTSISWTWIWSLRLPEKFKFFIWLACHDAVPTLSLLNHRNIAHSDQCNRCGQHAETLIHCIHDCLHSSKIWRHIGFNTADFFIENDAYLWLKHGLKGPHSLFFAAILWWIWRYQNSMCFSSEVWSLHRISFNIQDTVNVIRTSFNLFPVAAAEDRVVKWNCFNYSCFIINVDGSCLGNP